MFFRRLLCCLAVCAAYLIIASCSGNPVIPANGGVAGVVPDHVSMGSHYIAGYFEISVDPLSNTIQSIPLRNLQLHLNALRFLEPPPPVCLHLENLQITGSSVDVDVSFDHPFPDYQEYSGFDVCGIVITSGSISGFSDPDIVIAGEGDTRLVNPDGLTRWWNPSEFPYNQSAPIFGYIDGVLGTPDDIANFSATLNGYKYHAEGLGADASPTSIDYEMRGVFPAGTTQCRHYTIELDAGLVFNYAIDASWSAPDGPPVVIPDSFPPDANRDEPWFVEAEVTDNTLYYNPDAGSGGGELTIQVTCYDWFDGTDNIVHVESPGVFEPLEVTVPDSGNENYSTYMVDLTDPVLDSADPIELLISVEAAQDYQGLLPGKQTSAYHPLITAEVEEKIPGPVILVWNPETPVDHPDREDYNDFEPAVITDGNGEVLIAFFRYEDTLTEQRVSYPLVASSDDNAHTFSQATSAYWENHSAPGTDQCWNGKYTLGSDGQAFHSYGGPDGHCLQKTPWSGSGVDPSAGSMNGTIMENAGEMMYTVDGYPMMFGDQGGTILMRRGDYPNEAGTQTYPDYEGTEYVLVAEAVLNYISTSRCTGMTSDGRTHLLFWHSGCPYIRMVSSSNSSGTSWNSAMDVYIGLAEIWVGGRNPSLWIDEHDGFHVVWTGEVWWGDWELMYGYSSDGTDWDEMTSFYSLETIPADDGLRDVEIVMIDAFGETYIFVCYESGGNIYCKYKNTAQDSWHPEIQVNEHSPAELPSIYPNGDTGVVFVYQADDGSGDKLTDVYYTLAEFIQD